MAEFDIVLYGATGFTGRRLAAFLASHGGPVRFALAGRRSGPLEALAESLGRPDVGVIVADSTDPASVRAMVARTRVVASTAGPYAQYGTPVVDACVDAGADYVDITGEVPWVRTLVDTFHDRAVEKGVRIVPFCGYDAIPSDLGARLAVEACRDRGVGCTRVTAVHKLRGGLNGGTLASAMGMSDVPLADLFDADRLVASLPSPGRPARDQTDVRYDEVHQTWTSPFMMAIVNRRVVRRSAALAASWGEPYGPAFDYLEAHAHSTRFKAWQTATALKAAMLLLSSSVGRRLATRFGPAPGEGPSEAALERGFFQTQLVGEAEDGGVARVTIRADGDPGNINTVRMVGASALALLDRDRLPDRAGILTPATAFGTGLADRLRATGIEITVG